MSAEQSLAQEPPRELVDVAPVARSPTADGDDEHRDHSVLDAIDDAIALADRTDTAESGELAHERLALFLGRCAELIGALADETPGYAGREWPRRV